MIIYTKQNCPMCKVAKLKLDNAGVKYEECHDEDKMQELGLRSIPVLQLDDGSLLKFGDIMNYVRGLQN